MDSYLNKVAFDTEQGEAAYERNEESYLYKELFSEMRDTLTYFGESIYSLEVALKPILTPEPVEQTEKNVASRQGVTPLHADFLSLLLLLNIRTNNLKSLADRIKL